MSIRLNFLPFRYLKSRFFALIYYFCIEDDTTFARFFVLYAKK